MIPEKCIDFEIIIKEKKSIMLCYSGKNEMIFSSFLTDLKYQESRDGIFQKFIALYLQVGYWYHHGK